MNPNPPRNYKGPEAIIQEAIIKFLEGRGWYINVMHGNLYQKGIPDLYAVKAIGRSGPGKRTQGIQRWIEVKNAESFEFTRAQLHNFSEWTQRGCGIWILVAANEVEYRKLFDPPNWTFYLNHPNRRR